MIKTSPSRKEKMTKHVLVIRGPIQLLVNKIWFADFHVHGGLYWCLKNVGCGPHIKSV